MDRVQKKRKKEVVVDLSEVGRTPPQALELERAVLGALMLEKDAYSEVSEILKPSSFYDHSNSLIYSAIQDLSIAQKPVDMLTVAEKLKEEGELEDVGGSVYLAELTEIVASSAHLEYHAKLLAKKAIARELIEYSSGIIGKAYSEEDDVDSLMQSAEAGLFAISQKNIKRDAIQIDPVIADAINILNAAAKRKDGISGIPSGFHEIDEITAGWQRTDLIIIAARPAMGKTAFVLSMAKNMAVDMKIPSAVFSLEMSKIQLVNRLIVNVCEIEGQKIKTGKLERYEWEQLNERISYLYGAPLYIDDTAGLSIFEFQTKARRLVRDKNVQIIIIDYLQLMNANGARFGSREQEVSTISRALKGLAKELNIPIIALSQLNRSVESRGANNTQNPADAKRPQLSDLRESGAIEQDADMVCFIHRPEYYKITQDPNGNDLRGIAEIIIAKNRNGATKDIRLRFKGQYARFMNLDDEPYTSNGGSIIGSKINSVEKDFNNDVPEYSSEPQNQDEVPF